MKLFTIYKSEENKHIKVLFGRLKLSFKNNLLSQCCEIEGKNNHVFITENESRQILKKDIDGLRIYIHGSNNNIEIHKSILFRNSVIRINGNNNTLKIEETKHYFNDTVFRIAKDDNKIIIGKNCSVGGANFHCDNGSEITLGDNCMLSDGIEIMPVDSHIITDMKLNKLNDSGNFCRFGNNVWIGRNVTILKNTEISDNNIIGTRSVVTKSFKENNVAIAGVPAKIVKSGIRWFRDEADYLKEFN